MSAAGPLVARGDLVPRGQWIVLGSRRRDHRASRGSSGGPALRPSSGDQVGCSPGARLCRPLCQPPMMYVWPAARQPMKSVRRRAKSWPGAAPKVSQVRNHHRASGPTQALADRRERGVQRVPGEQRAGVERVAVDVRAAPLAVPPELQLGDRPIGLDAARPRPAPRPTTDAPCQACRRPQQPAVQHAAGPPRVRQAGAQRGPVQVRS
jgi:hypothetical protein